MLQVIVGVWVSLRDLNQEFDPHALPEEVTLRSSHSFSGSQNCNLTWQALLRFLDVLNRYHGYGYPVHRDQVLFGILVARLDPNDFTLFPDFELLNRTMANALVLQPQMPHACQGPMRLWVVPELCHCCPH